MLNLIKCNFFLQFWQMLLLTEHIWWVTENKHTQICINFARLVLYLLVWHQQEQQRELWSWCCRCQLCVEGWSQTYHTVAQGSLCRVLAALLTTLAKSHVQALSAVPLVSSSNRNDTYNERAILNNIWWVCASIPPIM